MYTVVKDIVYRIPKEIHVQRIPVRYNPYLNEETFLAAISLSSFPS